MTKTNGLDLDELAPGLRGYTMEHGGATYIPALFADKPGNGALTKYLDKLEKDGVTIKVPNVLSARLEAYLERRGYVLIGEYSPQFQEVVPVWVKEPA